MSDIFLSYDSADRAIAQKFADALESLGWSVWWDREIPLGKVFDQVIEQELNAARCVIVLWSKESVRSRWVKTEASAAVDRECLIPVLIEATEIPLEFKRIQTAMLLSWQGDAEHPAFEPVIQAVGLFLDQKSSRSIASPGAKEERKLLQSQTPRRRVVIAMAAILLVGVGTFALLKVLPNDVLPPGSTGAVVSPSVSTPPLDSPEIIPPSTSKVGSDLVSCMTAELDSSHGSTTPTRIPRGALSHHCPGQCLAEHRLG